MRSAGGLDGTRDVDGRATADQVRMVRDVATMFEDLRAMADRYAELHADRAQLEAELEPARQDADRQRADHTAELERVRDELVRARQDAGLWREETDRERARITNMQADADRAGDGAAPDRERAGAGGRYGRGYWVSSDRPQRPAFRTSEHVLGVVAGLIR
jgi:septal ring factor EnvC (AmiA/AmiB activator)